MARAGHLSGRAGVTLGWPGCFVFDRDGDVTAFPSLQAAAAFMESIDVMDGEYESLFTLSGEVVTAFGQKDAPVILTVTETVDLDALVALLERYRHRAGLVGNTRDLVAVANELMHRDWEARWPKRPLWLARRWHGTGPPHI